MTGNRKVAEICALTLFFLPRTLALLGAESNGTVPFIFDDNRVFAQLEFVRPDGIARKAYAFVDLGTPVMCSTKSFIKSFKWIKRTPSVSGWVSLRSELSHPKSKPKQVRYDWGRR